MSESLQQVLYNNAIALIAQERRRARRIDEVYRTLTKPRVNGAIEDWLANPFIQTAIGILEKFSNNYKIREALKLLKAAGEEAEKAKRPGRRGKA